MAIDSNARAGLRAAGLWTLLEFAIRYGLIVAAAGGLVLFHGKVPRESDINPLQAGMIAAIPLALSAISLAMVFKRWATQEQLTLRDLGYQFDRRSVLAGVASGLFLILVGWPTSSVDAILFKDGSTSFEMLVRLMIRGGPLVLVAMLVANGILTPIAEEYAWRGYIQHRLVQAWGMRLGLLLTALLFAAKHIVVDVSLGRTTTLLVLAGLVGLIRWRWGTTASTVAHCVLNLFGTSLVFEMPAGLTPL